MTTDSRSDLLRERFALRSLLDFAQTLTPELGVEGIIRSVLRTIMGKALIQDSYAYVHRSYFPAEIQEARTGEFLLVTQSGFRDRSFDLSAAREYIEEIADPEAKHPTIVVPIYEGQSGELISVLGFGRSILPNADLSVHHTFVEALAVLTGMALTNARLFENEKLRERLEAEMRLARDIQNSLFPSEFPFVAGLEFAGIVRPSGLVGGDYYDVIKLSGERVLLCIADVVGKGISAAIIMSNLQAALRALVPGLRDGEIGLEQIVARLNELIFEHTSAERFITGVFAVLDISSKTIESCVCGHPCPVVITSDRKTREIPGSGIPLGILPDFIYHASVVPFSTGDTVVLYTDGLSEATETGRSAMLGLAGVERMLREQMHGGEPLADAINRIVGGAGLEFEDDLTILAVRAVHAR